MKICFLRRDKRASSIWLENLDEPIEKFINHYLFESATNRKITKQVKPIESIGDGEGLLVQFHLIEKSTDSYLLILVIFTILNPSSMTTDPIQLQVYTVEPSQVVVAEPTTIPVQSSVAEASKKDTKKYILIIRKCAKYLKEYFKKFRGTKENRPKRIAWDEYIWTFLGSFISISLIAFLHYRLLQT